MDLSWIHFAILIVSGVLVGFINTLAGGGSIISLSVFMLFGLPPQVANGTNRIAIALQNLTATSHFAGQKMIPWRQAWRLAIPVILGAVGGSFGAGSVSSQCFRYLFGLMMLFMAAMLFVKPDRWRKSKPRGAFPPFRFHHDLLLFAIGLYGGFIHVGVGYLLLAFLLLFSNDGLVEANALKNFLILAYIPFSLALFILQGDVDWTLGLIHSLGNIIGARIGVLAAVKKGAPLIRYLLLFSMIVVLLQLFGLLDAESLSAWIKRL